ncbi:uncharacterized protein LOC112465123 [Temnothorax curvispinosus]|uniref:Uncharacterized protein LOC112465123 n=1 Tax=Temnothorax curvispinosus TaxID=300111 RepID=A0A6J1R2E8_9HYME|nr:uncharacterized protein LOC112465123 [Temnothorax curvispinosus]
MSLVKRISYEEEKKKNPELKDSDIQILKDWAMKQSHLPKILDVEYVLFLHSNYYRIEAAKNTIEEYYTSRTHMPEFFSDRDPLGTKQLREIFKVVASMTLPMTTKEGYKLVYSRLIDYEPSRFVYNDVMKYFSMVVDLWLYTEGTAEGHIIIIDMADVTFAHAGRLSPMGIKRYLYYLQEAIPIRLKGLHFINTNAVMDIILSMMKPFMKKELMEVLHIHPTNSTKDTLATFVPLEAFPCDIGLGGKAKPLKEQQEEILKKIEDHREWYLQDEITGRVNEALRVGKSKTMDLFGVEGSFKKLDISTYRVRSSDILCCVTNICRTDPPVNNRLRNNWSRSIRAPMSALPTRYVSIEEECKRNPELKMSDLQMLKDWMEKQPHLPRIEMVYLVMFLHSNYYRIEPTKKTIDNFFTIRTLLPEVFCNRDPIAWKELRKAFSVIAAVPLEEKTKEGYVMTLVRFLDPNPNKFDHFECTKYLLMTCEVQNVVHGTSEGLVVILDAAGLSFSHVAAMNLMGLKKVLFYIQEAAPVRLKALHVLNAMPIVDTFLNLLKPFIKKEMMNLLHFHSNMETVKKYLPIKALPNEYGGKAGPIEEIAAKHIQLLEEFRDYFQYDEANGRVNESLRVGKCESAENLFGVDGSFKKLELD